jgi:hypothetical protein
MRLQIYQILPIEVNVSVGRGVNATDAVQKTGLARSVRTNQGKKISSIDIEGDVIQDS